MQLVARRQLAGSTTNTTQKNIIMSLASTVMYIINCYNDALLKVNNGTSKICAKNVIKI